MCYRELGPGLQPLSVVSVLVAPFLTALRHVTAFCLLLGLSHKKQNVRLAKFALQALQLPAFTTDAKDIMARDCKLLFKEPS